MDNNRTYVARCAIRYKGSTFEWALRWRKEEPINNKPAISVSLNEVENADVFIILSRDCLHNKILKIWEKISPKPPDFCTQQEFLCKCLSSVPTDYLEHIMQVPVLN